MFLDLEDAISELFSSLTLDDRHLDPTLRFDSSVARTISHETQWLAEARLAPDVVRWHCGRCGEEIEQRPGNPRPVHMGRHGVCAAAAAPQASSWDEIVTCAQRENEMARRRKHAEKKSAA